jgi:carboxyl-terminal processing protease
MKVILRRCQTTISFWAVIILTAGFIPSLQGSNEVDVEKQERSKVYEQMEKLVEAMLHIKHNYVVEKDYSEIINGAIHGMLRALDPHSDYLDEEAYKELQTDAVGEFGGIGIQLGVRDGVLTVIAPIEDTPAYKAGILPGDKIIEIDGEKTQDMRIEDAVKKLRGKKDTKVTLKILRPRPDRPQEMKFEIIRDIIEIPSIKGARILRGDTGYVRITLFQKPTPEMLAKALNNLFSKGAKSLIIDLRNNPGGLLDSAVSVASIFLENKTVVVTTKGREGVMPAEIRRAYSAYHAPPVPIAVLVNGGSASASEIVAGALQDHKRAVLIGEKTFGKGSVQSIIQLKSDNKTALRLTTAYYFTPSGRLIHEKGIEPDVYIEVSPEEWQQVQLKRAYEENPTLYSEEEKARVAHVTDRVLERAIDILLAVRVFKAEK